MNKVNFIFLQNYFFKMKCINFEKICDIVDSYTSKDIDNQNFKWGKNCLIDRITIHDDNIADCIYSNIQSFVEEMEVKVNVKLERPWINLYQKGYFQEIHDHAESDFSATIFINSGYDFSKFYFYDRFHYRNTKIMKKEFTLNDVFYPELEQGDIIIFPAHMLHGVSPHKNDTIRKTISFNFNIIDK